MNKGELRIALSKYVKYKEDSAGIAVRMICVKCSFFASMHPLSPLKIHYAQDLLERYDKDGDRELDDEEVCKSLTNHTQIENCIFWLFCAGHLNAE